MKYQELKQIQEISPIFLTISSDSMINCVKFHNSLPIFGSSGQRIFKYDQEEEKTQEYILISHYGQ
eukprot:gene5629-9446_t